MFNYKLEKEKKKNSQEKKEKLDSFHHCGLGSIDSDSLSTLVQKWEQLGVPECDMAWNTAGACILEERKSPHVASKNPPLPSFG